MTLSRVQALVQNNFQAQLTTLVALGYDQTIYFPAQLYLVTTNTTIPSSITLEVDHGALINVATGVTLTVNGAVHAPQGTNIFQGAGTIAGDFGDQPIDPDWLASAGADSVIDAVPVVDWVDAAVAAAGGDIVIRGRNLLQSQTFDSITIAESAASITVFALKPGDTGYTVAIGTPSGGAAAVTFAAGLLTIIPAAAGSTDDAMATAVNAASAASDGYFRATSASGGSFTGAAAAVAMAGGAIGHATSFVKVSNVECLPANETGTAPTAKWSDTAITVTVGDLTAESEARAATDHAAVVVSLDGRESAPVAVTLT